VRVSQTTGTPCAADSQTLVTASADTTAKLWDVPTGKNFFTFDFDRQGARGTAFSIGGREVVITVDPFMGTGSSIRIFKMFEDRAERACPSYACGCTGTRRRR
jgi:WD40 repeat protein